MKPSRHRDTVTESRTKRTAQTAHSTGKVIAAVKRPCGGLTLKRCRWPDSALKRALCGRWQGSAESRRIKKAALSSPQREAARPENDERANRSGACPCPS